MLRAFAQYCVEAPSDGHRGTRSTVAILDRFPYWDESPVSRSERQYGGHADKVLSKSGRLLPERQADEPRRQRQIW
jgi:hypothetical protein